LFIDAYFITVFLIETGPDNQAQIPYSDEILHTETKTNMARIVIFSFLKIDSQINKAFIEEGKYPKRGRGGGGGRGYFFDGIQVTARKYYIPVRKVLPSIRAFSTAC
jgi:hypothetical protein